MLWEDKVEAWRTNEVTEAFFASVQCDIYELTAALIMEEDTHKMMRLQGMIRALKGVADMPDDGIDEPKMEGN